MISFRVTIYNIVLPENNPVKGLLFGLKSYGIKQGVGFSDYAETKDEPKCLLFRLISANKKSSQLATGIILLRVDTTLAKALVNS
jgi:hypothetical protein